MDNLQYPANKIKRKHEELNNAFMIDNKKKIKPTHNERQELVKEFEEDRLTNLPEPLKVHILSFLSIKQAVKTSRLSKSWVSLWTLCPTLNIDSKDFATTYRLRDVDKIVRKILDKSAVKLNKVTLHRYVFSNAKIWKTVFGYALSNGVKEVIASINSGNGGSWPDCLGYTSSDSLTRLELISDTEITCPILGQKSFKNLTNLYLREAIITNNPDSFSGFPALDKLTLYDCCYKDDNYLNVRASQLSALTIKCSDYCRLDRCELLTPKLRIFKFRTSVCTFPVFIAPPQALPVLDEFVFDHQGSLSFGRVRYQKQIFHQAISIFQTFHNAKSLAISKSILELLSMFPMELMIGCSPFRGLKYLKLDQEDGSGEIPLEVQDYLLQHSADAKISVVKIKRG